MILRLFFSLIILLNSWVAFSQVEQLLPLKFWGKSGLRRTVSDTILEYSFDTLSLPLIDDFSHNHVQKINNKNSTLVSVTKYYKYQLNNNKIDVLKYKSTPPGKFSYDSISKKDTSFVLLNNSLEILNYNLQDLPITSSKLKIYPNYDIYDTIGVKVKSDTIWSKTSSLIQDSIAILHYNVSDKNAYWIDSNVYINDHYAINPWTVGVATFDGLDYKGYPYFINTSIRGYGDYLTSKPINLKGLKISDSIYFSFLYQAKGFGDAPENINMGSTSQHDSLCLQFYNPTTNKWISYWSTTVSEDPDISIKEFNEFKRVHLLLKDTAYFKENFQFRFVNYADLSGSLDHFHIDYIKFRKNSGYQDTLFKDFALIYPVKSILKTFTSIPWSHFKSLQNKAISDSIKVSIRNGSNISENNQDGGLKIVKNGTELNNFVLNGQSLSEGVVNFAPFTFYTSYYNFKSQINIPDNNEDSSSIKITAYVSAPFLNNPDNDTTHYYQKFYDYYSYDDGTAEAGYGLKSAQSYVSYRFSTLKSDSLIGATIYFLPSVNDKSKNQFALTVWKDNNGIPGEIIYEDDDFSLHNPIYASNRDEFTPYYFNNFKKIFVDTSFFIGMRQIDNEVLNIGFDKNTNALNRVYYSLDKSSWNKSEVDTLGSLMIRPIFSSSINKSVGFDDLETTESFEIYPNPVTDKLIINSNSNLYVLKDIQGREVYRFEKSNFGNDISFLSSGVYVLIDLKSGVSKKIIKE